MAPSSLRSGPRRRRAPVSPSGPPVWYKTPPQGETAPAASWRGRVCCGRAHSRPTGLAALCSIWGVQGAGPDPLVERIHPWPIVVIPQGLLRRGRRVSSLVSSRGGGTHPGPLQSGARLPLFHGAPRAWWRGGELRCPIDW
ncbi:hypothetical protein NDU88_003156 [Pleurodeles waltl]|uniref:Uncharacterized protein n=1 Tax=Pleurodeles waltl TaxID=8319 RepID=A0AAV7TMN1_PLEWA|nr:hypothetical protein NDU88_003156 [Pleurodeles waltl]